MILCHCAAPIFSNSHGGTLMGSSYSTTMSASSPRASSIVRSVPVIVSPLGSTIASAWDGIVNGRSGVGRITRMDVSAFPVQIGAQAAGFTAEDYMSPKDVRKFDPFVPFGFASAVQAIKDSALHNDARRNFFAVFPTDVHHVAIDGKDLVRAFHILIPFADFKCHSAHGPTSVV